MTKWGLLIGAKYPILVSGLMAHQVELRSCNGEEVQVAVLAYEDEQSPKMAWECLPEPICMTFSITTFIKAMEDFYGKQQREVVQES